MTAAVITGIDGRARARFGAGERARMRVLVTEPREVLLTEGGIDAVRHACEDLGFVDVQAFADVPPPSWRPRAVGVAAFPDFLVWVEATPRTTMDVAAQIGPAFEVTDAWDDFASPVSRPAASPSRLGVAVLLLAITGVVGLGAIGALLGDDHA